jgi:hypothetical protein
MFEREEGEDLVQELNRDYPDIQHELVKAESRTLTRPAQEAALAPSNEESEDSSVQSPHVISFNA